MILPCFGEALITVLPQSEPSRALHPMKFEVPLLVGIVLGTSTASMLLVSVKSESNRIQQKYQTLPSTDKTSGKGLEECSTPITAAKDEHCPPGDLEFYDWELFEDEAAGALIVGNSGSAKTSLACWLAGHLTRYKSAQILALDPHANRNPLWEQLKIKVLSDFNLIEYQLELLENLLDERRKRTCQPKDDDRLIVFTDEIGACIKNFKDSNKVERVLERLGSEGRKYDIMLIAMNQSSNVDDIGISAQNRNNFVLVLCGAAARSFAESKWKIIDKRSKWIQSQAYPCVVTGAVPSSITKHPTHHTYKTFKKKANPPIGMQPINQLPLTIPLAGDCQPSLTPEARQLLNWLNRKSQEGIDKFKVRDIQRGYPLGKNTDHKLE